MTRLLYLTVVQGKVRAVPRGPIPHYVLHPHLYYAFGSDLPSAPNWDNAIPEIPSGWRPLLLYEKPTRASGALIYWYFGDGIWEWANYGGYGSLKRVIIKI